MATLVYEQRENVDLLLGTKTPLQLVDIIIYIL